MILPIATMIILCCLLRYHMVRNAKLTQYSREQFWEKERLANATRKKDISHLPYLQIPVNDLPFSKETDPVSDELRSIEQQIRDLSTCQILDLSEWSNTDLKCMYGTANFPFLSQCDENFHLLRHALYRWALWLFEHDRLSDASQVLQYAISCHADCSKTTILLRKIQGEKA